MKLLKDNELKFLFVLLILTLLTGTIFYHFVEDWRWIDSFYFSVITVTTVGYGDLTPTTDLGKIFTVIYVFAGIGIIFGFINRWATHRLKMHKKSILKKSKKLNR